MLPYIISSIFAVVCILAPQITNARLRGPTDDFELEVPRIFFERANSLLARQGIPNVPSQCKPACDPVNSILSTGTCSPANCCTAKFEQAYFDCFLCVGKDVGLTDFSAPQQIVDSIVTTCARRGFSIPKLTFPGQNPDRPLSTTIVSKSTTATSTATSSTTTSSTTTTTSASSGSQQTVVPTPSPPISVSQTSETSPPGTTTPTPTNPPASFALRTSINGVFCIFMSLGLSGSWVVVGL